MQRISIMNNERIGISPVFLNNEFFQKFTDSEKEELLDKCRAVSFSPGQVVLREGANNSSLFYLDAGILSVTKKGTDDLQGVEITTLNAGAFFGEMSVLGGVPVSATIKAYNAVRLFIINLDHIDNEKVLQAVKLALGSILVDRLESTNQDVQIRNERELKLLEIQNSAARFLVANFIVLSVYIISLPMANWFAKVLPTDSLVSLFFILTFAMVTLFFLRGEKGRFTEYGISKIHAMSQVKTGVFWSIPPIVIYIAFKMFYLSGSHSSEKIFDLSAVVAPNRNRLMIVVGLSAMYFIFSFAQETVRCVVQKATEIYQRRSSKHAPIIALFVSNLVFAATHSHLGPTFPMIAFIAGIYWGTLYIIRGSYLSCAVCHGLMGSVIIFVVGVPY